MTTPPVRYSIALPQIFVDEPLEPAAILAFAQRAETLGYDGLWTQDQLLGPAGSLEPTGVLCYVAAVTTRVRLGCSVLVLGNRTPVPLAKVLGTLDQLSRGRLEVGVGLGNPSPHARAFGHEGTDRLGRFNESLAVLKALWADGAGTNVGPRWPLTDAPMEPKPVQRPHPRLWFGGRHPNALARAVRQGNGWMGAGSGTLADFYLQLNAVKDLLAASARSPGTFGLSKRLYLAIDDDRARAEARLRSWFGAYYGNADLASRVCVWGSLREVGDAVAEIVAAGANHLLLNPVFDQTFHLEALAEMLDLGSQPPSQR